MRQFLATASQITLLLFAMTVTNTSLAETSVTQVGRYLTITNQPQAAQVDLLSQTVQVRFPPNVQTIGEAMDYVLKFSGYSLVPQAQRSAALKTTLTKPLPAVDRDFGPVSLKAGLMTLAGPAFSLKQDPVARMVNFQLKPRYAAIYQYTSVHGEVK